MKYLHLVLANLGRHKRRTLVTIAVALALFLFASLRTVVTPLAAAAQFGGARRLVSTNATGIVFPLPLSYANKLQATPGVKAVSWANWFLNDPQDPKDSTLTFRPADPRRRYSMNSSTMAGAAIRARAGLTRLRRLQDSARRR